MLVVFIQGVNYQCNVNIVSVTFGFHPQPVSSRIKYILSSNLLYNLNKFMTNRSLPFVSLLIYFMFLYKFLAHLSQRLIGELIVYPWSSVRPSVVRSQCSNISETAGPIKAKFYVEPPWVGGSIFCSRHLGRMTKVATTPIYGKNPSKIFSRTGGPIFTKLGM